MRSFLYTLFTISALSPLAAAHMEVVKPPPYRSKVNPNVAQANIDYSMTTPLKPDGSDFPCKGYNVDFDTPAGASTGTVTAGQTSAITIEGSASHKGGSCQISLSFDGGKSFKVVKSFIGNCVRVTRSGVDPNQTYEYTVPSNTKAGDAILAWSWFNRVGNREMYMNCATITIRGGGTSTLDSHPNIFECHIGNGCKIPEGVDVVFQNPGTDVTYSQGNYGNSTQEDVADTPLPMPPGSQIAVGVFMGLGGAVVVGLLAYYGWTCGFSTRLYGSYGPGTSGILCFKFYDEYFIVTLVVHNNKRWIDVSTGLPPSGAATYIHAGYYTDGNYCATVREKQLSKFDVTSPQGRNVEVDFEPHPRLHDRHSLSS